MSSKIKVGLNGFGRIGRISLRSTFTHDSNVEVVMINDPCKNIDELVALLNFDSAHGRFIHLALSKTENDTKMIQIVDRKDPSILISEILVTSFLSPVDIPWGLMKTEVVADCTGVFLTRDKLKSHLGTFNSNSSVKKVVLSAPPGSTNPGEKKIPLFVMGVNSDKYNPSENIISNASCTTNCLAPMVKIINDNFKIKTALMTTVHAVTINQPIVDCNKSRSIRMGFSGMNNIIHSTTGAAKAVGEVIPEVNGIITGFAFRVPVLTGSVVDLTFSLVDKKIKKEDIIQKLKEESWKSMKGVLIVDESDSLTSSCIVGNSYSSIVDEKACISIENSKEGEGSRLFKFVSWYDNEYGYSCRLMELCALVGEN